MSGEIVKVLSVPGHCVLALGAYRAGISRLTARKWTYRVWGVLDPETRVVGTAVGVRKAIEAASRVLKAIAQ